MLAVNDDDPPILAYLLLAALIGPPTLGFIYAKASDAITQVNASPASSWVGWLISGVWLQSAIELLLGGLVAVLVAVSFLRLYRWVAARRAEVRATQRESLTAELKAALPSWNPDPMRIKWRGRYLWFRKTRVKAVSFKVTGLTLNHPESKPKATGVLERYIGELAPVQWPDPTRGSSWVRVRAAGRGRGDVPAQVAEETPSGRIATVTSALQGLVPEITVDEIEGGGLCIAYGETTRDQSGGWRTRVVEQVRGRTGEIYRERWDRRHRTLTLTPVPRLPEVALWHDRFSVTTVPTIKGGRVIPYGVDEHGAAVGWAMGSAQPHTVVAGETGSGKSETMKAIAASAVRGGAMVCIFDPKLEDWTEFLGQPGVVFVAQSIEDRMRGLDWIVAQLSRRNAAKGAARLQQQYADRFVVERLPAISQLDEVPLVIVVDEMAVLIDDIREYWASLTKEERRAEWGTDAKDAPALKQVGYVSLKGRSGGCHLIVGMQQAGAKNFGGTTESRDQFTHLVSMGKQTPIGSRMVWGDMRGTQVEIEGKGEGLTTGIRFDPQTGEVQAGPGRVGRFKAWYTANELQQQGFWDAVREVAPDASQFHVPGMSEAARDPQVAAQALYDAAFGANAPVLRVVGETQGAPAGPGEQRPAEHGGHTTEADAVAATTGPPEHLESGDTAGITGPTAAEEIAAGPLVDEDAAEAEWEECGTDDLVDGDRVMLCDGEVVVVVEQRGLMEDDLLGDEVVRLVVCDGDGERELDLSPDELVSRLPNDVSYV